MRGEKKGKRTVFKGQKERRVLGSALGRKGKGENRKRRRRGQFSGVKKRGRKLKKARTRRENKGKREWFLVGL